MSISSRANILAGNLDFLTLLSKYAGWENFQCGTDVKMYLESFRNQSLWALQMFDSTTKIPNGLLSGNLYDLGNFEECLQVKLPLSESKGQFCLASLPVPIPSTSNDSSQVEANLLWSYCIPSSCTSVDLQHVLNLAWYPLTGRRATVSPADCQVTTSKELSTADIVGISLCSIVALLCLMSTIYDIYVTSGKRKSRALLTSFSVVLNGKRLLNTNRPPESIKAMDGLRFLSMAWIVLAHRFYFTTTSPIMNLLQIPEEIKNIRLQLIVGALLAVDTFFLLSGMLNAYLLLKALDKLQKFPALRYYLHRYIRTTPALAAMVLIYATWYSLLGSGPVWDRSVYIWKQLCVDNWWPTLIYINNYYNPVAQCAGQSWYLAVDMQLYWIAPIFIYPCWKWPKVSYFLLTLLLLLSVAGNFATAFTDRIKMPFTISPNLEEYKRVTQSIYVPTHARATPYIIGAIMGLFHYRTGKSSSKFLRPKMVTITLGWLASSGLCLSALFGNYPFMQTEEDHPYNQLESSFYISLYRVAWSLGISWVVLACIYGFAGPVNAFLSWNGFAPLSRLTYGMFLTQLAVQEYQLGSFRTTGYFSDFDTVHRYFGDLILTVICSAILCLMFESPVQMIEKYLQQPRGNTKEKDGDLKIEVVGFKNNAYEE